MNTVEEIIEKISKDHSLNKSDIAVIAETTPQNVTNWIARNSISKKKAKLIADKLGYNLNWLMSFNEDTIKDTRLKLAEWESMPSDEKNNGDFVSVPVLDVELSAGHGSCNDSEVELYTLPFRAYTIKQRNIQLDMVKVVRVAGDSMEPRLFDNDTISINMADTRIRDGKIYAVRVYDTQKVKILIKNSDGTITLRSFNPDYKDEIISKQQIESGEFQVLGRMWWSSSLDD